MLGGLSFRIAGIPVRLDPTLVLVAVLLGLGRRTGVLLAAWVGVVLVSVLIHELGHAFAFRRYGQEPSIVLAGMGGLTSGSGEPLPPRRDLVVSVAGPLLPVLALVVPGFLLLRADIVLGTTLRAVVVDVVVANVAWTVLNLLPVLPLDGGRVAASVVGLVTRRPGEPLAHRISIVVALAGAAAGLAAGYTFSALLAGFLVAYNVGQLGAGRNQALSTTLVGGWEALLLGDDQRAAETADSVLAQNPARPVMTAATELRAWALLGTDGPDAATEALRRIPHGETPNPALQAAVALRRGDRDEALAAMVAAFRQRAHGPHSPTAAERMAAAGLVDELGTRLLADPEAGPDAAAELAVHLHIAGRYDDAGRLGERVLLAEPSDPAQVAYNLACSQARAGHSSEALWWLERAADEGFADAAQLERDPDLASLRASDRFDAVRRRMPRR